MVQLSVPTAPPALCEWTRGKLSAYLDGDLHRGARDQIDSHLRLCRACRVHYITLRNVVALLGDRRSMPLPVGFSQRLRERVQQSVR